MEKQLFPVESDKQKVMKTFFLLKSAIRDIRNAHSDVLYNTSVEDLYDIVIEVLDLVRFARRANVHQRARPYLNLGMKEEFPPHPPRRRRDADYDLSAAPQEPSRHENANFGGLVEITFKNPRIPISDKETYLLDEIQQTMIKAKRALLREDFRSIPRLTRETVPDRAIPTKKKRVRRNRRNSQRRIKNSK